MTMVSEHWGYTVLVNDKKWANIFCPTLTEDRVNGFGDMRAILRELKSLEIDLRKLGFRGWVLWTELKNIHIIKILTKLKSFPYGINIKRETIWFRKEL